MLSEIIELNIQGYYQNKWFRKGLTFITHIINSEAKCVYSPPSNYEVNTRSAGGTSLPESANLTAVCFIAF